MRSFAQKKMFKIGVENFALESDSTRVDVKGHYNLASTDKSSLVFEITDKRYGSYYSIQIGIDSCFNMRDSKDGITTFSGMIKNNKILNDIFNAENDKEAYSKLLELTIGVLENGAKIEGQRALQRNLFFVDRSAIMSAGLSNFAKSCIQFKSDIPNMVVSKNMPYSIYD